MCGIAGIIAPSANRLLGNISSMLSALSHRGPDANGEIVFDHCALGHTRLSIVDIAGSPQPMRSDDSTVAVTFNGEIYGYKQLRDGLSDYPFRTVGDTEVLLALYQRYGNGMLQNLPGMFSFAIWDDRTESLFCARDRFGEKPFYYATGINGEFIFASEIKGILASGLVEPVLSQESVRHYLRRAYVHPTRTIYRNVSVLPPAHQLTYHKGKIEVSRYWSLPEPGDVMSLEAAGAQFKNLFHNAVKRQLIADVPVGVFLSGGLDSSTIVAVAAQQSTKCRTFSFGFGESINELPYAREIASRYGTEHIELSDESADVAELLVQMQEIYDEPFGDSSNIPVFLLSKLARRHITVALAGEGGDELTGGYDFWYRPIYNFERACQLPDSVATLIRIAAAACKIARAPLPRSLAELWEGFFMKHHYRDALAAHYARNGFFSDIQIDGLIPRSLDEVAPTPLGAGVGVDSVLRADIQDYLAGDVLAKTDRASMANGLEIRCPFLDVDLASFCISLPTRLKMNSYQEKLVLRAAFSDAWSPAIRKRRKQGFGAPVTDWLKRSSVRDLKHSVLGNPNSALYDLLAIEQVEKVIEADSYQTWLLLVLGMWLEKQRELGTQQRFRTVASRN